MAAVILEPNKIKSVTVSIVSPSVCLEVMGPNAVILVLWMLSFKQAFLLSYFTFIKSLFISPFAFHHKGGVICIPEVIDISPDNFDSSLCFIRPSILHDVLCISVKKAWWQYTALMYSFPNFEPVCCSMSGYNCCFLTCIQVSQEAGQVVWYSYLKEFSRVCCDPHSQRLWHSQWSRGRCFSGILLLSLWSNQCW